MLNFVLFIRPQVEIGKIRFVGVKHLYGGRHFEIINNTNDFPLLAREDAQTK